MYLGSALIVLGAYLVDQVRDFSANVVLASGGVELLEIADEIVLRLPEARLLPVLLVLEPLHPALPLIEVHLTPVVAARRPAALIVARSGHTSPAPAPVVPMLRPILEDAAAAGPDQDDCERNRDHSSTRRHALPITPIVEGCE
jgi:hypothetical protein